MIATICERCAQLHDPTCGWSCPCHAPPATEQQVARRHRDARRLAATSDRQAAAARADKTLWTFR